MKVTLLSISDCAGQNWLLADAMRKHLGWDAKSYSLSESYLQYPTDGIVGKDVQKEDIELDADLFIFQDVLFKIPGIELDKAATVNNTIIYGLGTLMRDNIPAIRNYIQNGWRVLPPLSDPTITRWLGGAPFEAIIVDPRVKELTNDIERSAITTICHAPTKTVKGEELFEKLVAEIPDVEWMVIKGKTWEEAIKEKAKAHITLDSISDYSYGLNCLEGVAMGHEVISSIAPWCYALNYDLPMHTIWEMTEEEMIEEIKETVNFVRSREEPDFLMDCQLMNDWLEEKYSPQMQALRWKHYIDWCLA